MGESGGKLPQRRQPLRAPRFGLRLLQPAVGLGQSFGEFAIQLSLVAALPRETIHHHCGKKKEHEAQPEQLERLLRQLVSFLHCREEISAVRGRGEQRPQHGRQRAAIERGRDHGNKIDRPVAAVDAKLLRVVEEKRGQHDLEQNHVVHAAAGNARNNRAFGHLHHTDGQEDDLLVPFKKRWKQGERDEKNKPGGNPDRIQPVVAPGLGIEDGRRGCHAASIQP